MVEFIYVVASFITFLGSAFLGIFVYLKNKNSTLHQSYFLMSFSVAFWSLGLSLCHSSVSFQNALIWNRFLHTVAIFIPILYFNFILELLSLKKKKKKILATGYIFSFILAGFSFTALLIKSVEPKYWFRFWPVPGFLYPLFLLLFFYLFFYSFCLLYKRHKAITGVERNQLRYIILGLVVGAVGGSTNYPLFYDIKIMPAGNFFVFFYVVLYAYAIVKYQLMDIKIAITRTGLIALVYLFVLGLPFWLGFTFLGRGAWVVPVLFMGVLATIGPFIYSYLRRRAENVLLREQKGYQRALRDFSSTLIFIKDIEDLVQKVVLKIMESIKLNFSALYLKDKESFCLRAKQTKDGFQLPDKIDYNSSFIASVGKMSLPMPGEYLPSLEKVNLGVVCPLFLKQELQGFILLGQKEKGVIFTNTDLDILSILSSEVSLSLSEIHYFQEYQKATHQKHKLEIEKARVESAFQIADAYRHELGNIINIISVSLMNLSTAGGYQPTKEDIEETRKSISNNVKRATQIFNAVKSYNENSNKELKPQKLDNLLNYALEEEKEILAKENIKLGLDITRNIEVKANNNLRSALIYLIKGAITAIDYIQPEEKLIQIKLTKNEDKALLNISDTGGDVTQDKHYQGVGIERGREGGILYFLARRIIFDHRGEFQFSSFGDKGTTFLIELPLI